VAKPTFFIKPLMRTRFTMLKAPMAHKTFSQEQFLYSFYNLKVFFRFNLPTPEHNKMYAESVLDGGKVLNVNQVLFLLLNLSNDTFFFETNLFFLQKLTFQLPSYDCDFMKLY
jgi:hypothetical protein